MKGSKWFKGLILAMGFTLISSISAFAATNDEGQIPTKELIAVPPDAVSGSVAGNSGSGTSGVINISEDILNRQAEIDQYLFKDHADEIGQAGFKVTHTAPMDGYVEVGITPYNDENANYIYKVLGQDQLKVVEGMQAVPLELTPEDGIVYTTTSIETDENKAADNEEPLMDKTAVLNGASSPESQLYTMTGAVDAARDSLNNTTSILPLIIALGALVILGGGFFTTRRMKAARKA